MDADRDTIATAFHVKIDDLLKDSLPQRAPWLPAIGIARRSLMLNCGRCRVRRLGPGHVRQTLWLRYADEDLQQLFPYLPAQSGTASACASWPPPRLPGHSPWL